MRTEDQVRSEAELVLGFNDSVPDVEQGVGQITTFNTLGFPGVLYKPDGWYLPKDVTEVAIILETKSESKMNSFKTVTLREPDMIGLSEYFIMGRNVKSLRIM